MSGREEYTLIATGERFRNGDGSSRQDELRRCIAREPVYLLREPDNPHDANAVALRSVRGVQLGYLNREHAAWIAREMDGGREVGAVVERVASKGRPGAPLALTIRILLSAQ